MKIIMQQIKKKKNIIEGFYKILGIFLLFCRQIIPFSVLWCLNLIAVTKAAKNINPESRDYRVQKKLC
jgi:hypothetical protein